VAIAFLAERAGFADALLTALDQDAHYANPNFLWFLSRYARFVYVDRVVTAREARGRGLASALYTCLIERAITANHERIGCEVNVDPPNPVLRRCIDHWVSYPLVTPECPLARPWSTWS
jgi:uncharacterized protein